MPSTGDRDLPLLDAERRFERCFRDHYAAVLAFAIRRLPDRATAEDAAAETFAVAWRRRELIPEAAAFRVRLHRARRWLAKHLEAAGHSPNERPARAPDPAEEAS